MASPTTSPSLGLQFKLGYQVGMEHDPAIFIELYSGYRLCNHLSFYSTANGINLLVLLDQFGYHSICDALACGPCLPEPVMFRASALADGRGQKYMIASKIEPCQAKASNFSWQT